MNLATYTTSEYFPIFLTFLGIFLGLFNSSKYLVTVSSYFYLAIPFYILIYLNTPGGSVYAGLGIYDTMQYINCDVSTICTGMAASMGAVLLCAGEKGKRTALKHSRVMIHQPLGGAHGQASDIEITANEIKKLKTELYEIISNHTGQKFDKVWADGDRDFWMKSDEAKDYGMIDEVLQKNK